MTEEVKSRGDDTARSGEAGSLDKKVGAELIRRGNQQPKGPLRDALKTEGQRLIGRGRGKSHKTQR